MKRKTVLLVSILLVVTVLTSCKKNQTVDPGGGTTPGPRVGDTAPNFTEIDVFGNSFTLESFNGRVIMLNFSTMWCGPCRAETPELLEIYNTYKERGFEIVQCIYQDEDSNPSDQSDLNRWLDEFQVTYTLIGDPDRSSVETYDFNAIPFNVIIDRNFVIQYMRSGFDRYTVEQKIEELL